MADGTSVEGEGAGEKCEIRFYYDNSEEFTGCENVGERVEMPVGYPDIWLCREHRSWAASLGRPFA